MSQSTPNPAAPAFTPAEAIAYMARVMPLLLSRAEGLMAGTGGGDGEVEPDRYAARLALLSAKEVLDELGAVAGPDAAMPQRAALERLRQQFHRQFPSLTLDVPHEAGEAPSLTSMLKQAWEDAEAGKAATKAPTVEAPGVGLPTSGSGLDL